jgi:outer membrane lipoprotein-sorting protein
MKKLTISAALLGCMFIVTSAIAETPEEKGFRIAAKSDRMDKGYGTSITNLKMILTNAAGKSTTRTLEIRVKEKPNEDTGDKSVTLFYTPPDVEGTALLSYANILESDNQWLFLPELSRVKRISSSNKSGPFVGSEFSFEDLTISELMKYSYKFVETKEEDGTIVDIIEWSPRYKRSGYSKLVAYYDKVITQPRKIEFYNRGGAHFKTLTLSDYRNYGGTIYRSHISEMKNHLTKKKTKLEFSSFKFGVKLNENEFKPSALTKL